MGNRNGLLVLLTVILCAFYWFVSGVLNAFLDHLDPELTLWSVIIVWFPPLLGFLLLFVIARFLTGRLWRQVFVLVVSVMIIVPAMGNMEEIYYNENRHVDQQFNDHISTILQKLTDKNENYEEKRLLDLSSLSEADWDKLHVIGPYSSGDEVNKQLGYKWTNQKSLMMDDSYNLLLFVKDNKVVGNIHYVGKIAEGIFSRSDKLYLLRKNDAALGKYYEIVKE